MLGKLFKDNFKDIKNIFTLLRVVYIKFKHEKTALILCSSMASLQEDQKIKNS